MLNGKLAYTNASLTVHVITTVLCPHWCSVVAINTFHRYESSYALVTRPSLHFLRWSGCLFQTRRGFEKMQLVDAYLSKMEIDGTPVWISHHPHSIVSCMRAAWGAT